MSILLKPIVAFAFHELSWCCDQSHFKCSIYFDLNNFYGPDLKYFETIEAFTNFIHLILPNYVETKNRALNTSWHTSFASSTIINLFIRAVQRIFMHTWPCSRSVYRVSKINYTFHLCYNLYIIFNKASLASVYLNI